METVFLVPVVYVVLGVLGLLVLDRRVQSRFRRRLLAVALNRDASASTRNAWQRKRAGEAALLSLSVLVAIIVACVAAVKAEHQSSVFSGSVSVAYAAGVVLAAGVGAVMVFLWLAPLLGHIVFHANRGIGGWRRRLAILAFLVLASSVVPCVLAGYLSGGHGGGVVLALCAAYLGCYSLFALLFMSFHYRPGLSHQSVLDPRLGPAASRAHEYNPAARSSTTGKGLIERHFADACAQNRWLKAGPLLPLIWIRHAGRRRERQGYTLTFLHHLGLHHWVCESVSMKSLLKDSARPLETFGRYSGRTRNCVALSLEAVGQLDDAKKVVDAEIEHLSKVLSEHGLISGSSERAAVQRKYAYCLLAKAHLEHHEHRDEEAATRLREVMEMYPHCALPAARLLDALAQPDTRPPDPPEPCNGTSESAQLRCAVLRQVQSKGVDDPSMLRSVAVSELRHCQTQESAIRAILILEYNVFCFEDQESKFLLALYLAVGSRYLHSTRALLEEILVDNKAHPEVLEKSFEMLARIERLPRDADGCFDVQKTASVLRDTVPSLGALAVVSSAAQFYESLRREVFRFYFFPLKTKGRVFARVGRSLFQVRSNLADILRELPSADI